MTTSKKWQGRFEGALKAGFAAHRRGVTAAELRPHLGQEAERELAEDYAGGYAAVSRRILTRLVASGCAVRLGKMGRENVYAPVGETCTAPVIKQEPRRRRVHRLVSDVVLREGRAVLLGEVVDALRPDHGLSPTAVRRDVSNLVRTGDLVVVKRGRGDARGGNFYLPADFERERFRPQGPVTWLERVAHVCQQFFETRRREGEAVERRFRPPGTGELRAAFVATYPDQPELRDAQLFVNALGQLARGTKPVLKRIRRPEARHMLWAPVEVPTEAMDLGSAYATDSERIREAVRRARTREGRPVRLEDVEHELQMDAALRPAGIQSVANILSDAARATLPDGQGGRVGPADSVIRRAGAVDGRPVYTTSEHTDDDGWVPYSKARSLLDEVRAEADAAAVCPTSAVRLGRRLLLRSRIAELSSLVQSAQTLGVPIHVAAGLRELGDEAKSAQTRLEEQLQNDDIIEVDDSTPVWLAADVLARLGPLYPAAARLDIEAKLIPLLDRAVRRVELEEGQVPTGPGRSHQKGFDQVSTLEMACARWGGTQARRAASCVAELGPLRDVRFVVSAASDADRRTRIAAAYTLGFFDHDVARLTLARLAVSDTERGVRNAATFALALSSSLAAFPAAPLLEWHAKDPDPLVMSTRRNVEGMRFQDLILM